jgi:hypothetical protein
MRRRIERARCRVLVVVLALGSLAPDVSAQETVTFRGAATFYGDNSEFSNLFRNGDTLFGTAARFAIDVAFNDIVTFRGGVFLNHRFASEPFVETVRPMFALTFRSEHQLFTMGTLDARGHRDGFGLDHRGPHGLIPPLQTETLEFVRPYEAGLQWQLSYPEFEQDAWIGWQRLNTVDARERFDVGAEGRRPVGTALKMSVAYQFHLVHEGGQQFASGPVRDSWAVGPGLIIEPRLRFFDRTEVEGYAMFSRHVPDRSGLGDAGHGHGIFTRITAEKSSWRGHLIVWGACDWIKEEGDENYGSLRLDDRRFLNTRHYGEIGVTKTFHPADGVDVEGSARFHRVEKDYNYSYRILAHVGLDVLVWRR